MRLIEKDGRLYCEKHGEVIIITPSKVGNNGHGSIPMCLKCKDLIERDVCIDCENHKATVSFAEGPFAAQMQMFDRLCRCCQIKRHELRIKYSTDIIEKVKGEMLVAPCAQASPVTN